MKIINPATEELISELTEDTKNSVHQKVKMLREGQKAWAKKPLSQRLDVIDRYGQLLAEKKQDLADTLTKEMGKPIRQSLNEIDGSLNRVRHIVNNASRWLSPEVIVSQESTNEEIAYEPLGVIANISAWNYPYNVGHNVFLYALTSGNAVAYKPSEYATLTGQKISRLLKSAGVPDDAFQLVIGGGGVGAHLLKEDLDGYYFTGSYKTGQHINKSVAGKLVPVQLELGGKDPLYVMDDVEDVKQVAAAVADGAFYNNGQSCCAVERVYVHQDIFEEFVQHFTEVVQGFKMGNPRLPDTYIGPLARKAQVTFLEEQVQDALDKGAKIETGGKPKEGKGYFFEPTVLRNVNHGMRVMREETFGPVIGIQSVQDNREAVELMNDTDYGLTAAVYSSDEKRARNLMQHLNAGTVYWNCCDRVSPNVPWSGRKQSGLGMTLSYQGIRAFTQPKAYHLRG